MTFTYQRFTAVLLIYGSLFLSGIYYYLRVFWCAAARMSELELEQRSFNRLTPDDPYMDRTAPISSKRCILYI